MKLEINVTKNRSGQSDRHSQVCDCQNSINDKFVPDNVRDRTLISRLVGDKAFIQDGSILKTKQFNR